MTARKGTSDEQFGVRDEDDGYEGPTTELDEFMGGKGYQIIDPDLDLDDENDHG